ncbi:MAG: 30S ribosomal protein S11 [Patescibacteria group bacterium]|nr:30S ribosomal protein S11 [Patescibacteria group bacterium]
MAEENTNKTAGEGAKGAEAGEETAKTAPVVEAAPASNATAPLVADEAPKSRPVQSKKASKGKRGKKRAIRNVSTGRCYIQATYNNTIVTLTDPNGNVLGWSSAGVCGFRGPKKSTPYAAGIIVRDAAEKVKDTGLREVAVFVRGIGSGREAAVRALHANGINVMGIKDVTPIPHNGCRARKPRRI